MVFGCGGGFSEEMGKGEGVGVETDVARVRVVVLLDLAFWSWGRLSALLRPWMALQQAR